MSELDLKRNIKLLLVYQIFGSMMFLGPVFILFLQEKFSLSEAILLQSIFTVSTGIFEVPAGVFADRFGKKLSLLIAEALGVVVITLYAVATEFWQYVVLEVLIGFSLSLTSGTVSAYLYDTLLSLSLEDNFKKIWGNMLSKAMLSGAFAGVMGGFLATFSYELTFYATSATAAIAFVVALFLKEPKIKKEEGKKSLIKEASIKLLKIKEVRDMVTLSTLIFIANQVLFNIYQPYWKLSGIDLAWFGVIFASFQVVSGYGSKFAHKFERVFGLKKGLWVLMLIVLASIFLLGNIVAIYSFAFIYLQQFVRGIRPILIEDFIHKKVDSKERTTAMSLISLVNKIAYFPAILMLSMLTKSYELVVVINIIGATFAILALMLWFMSKRRV